MKRDTAPGIHGGNVYRLSEELSYPLERILDFSASINPLGPPPGVLAALGEEAALRIRHYPDPEARELVSLLAGKHGIDEDSLLVGNGSTELIYLVMRALKPRRLVVLAPTYSEYERAFRGLSGREESSAPVLRLPLSPEESFAPDAGAFSKVLSGPGEAAAGDLICLCNPNNPTGGCLEKSGVIKIAEAARERGIYLAVDESYADFLPADISVMGETRQNPFLIVLRSLTKFYGLPGLRIGFGVFPRPLLPALRRLKEPWSTNALAQMAGVIALKDGAYRRETAEIITLGKDALYRGLIALGMRVFPSAVNFFLIQTTRAPLIAAGLRQKGILVRSCADFAGLDETYLRIAVRSKGENEILMKEMEGLCRG